jgi:hypothetical protein
VAPIHAKRARRTPVENFPDPPPNDATKPVLRGAIGGITLPIDTVTGKIATSSTPPEYVTNRTFVPPHDILYYVNKDDPRGPAPTDPTADPQYQLWEDGVQAWVKHNQETSSTWNTSFEDPPTEYDDAPSFDLLPNIDVASPAPSSTLVTRSLDVTPNVSAPRGVSRVVYRLDGRTLATLNSAPFDLHTYLAGVPNDIHTLTVTAEDDMRNQRQLTIPFTLAAGAESPYATWLNDSMALTAVDFPRIVLIQPFDTSHIRSITVYRQSADGASRENVGTITDFSNLFGGHVQFTIDSNPGFGTWTYSLEISTTSGQTIEGGTMQITVN